MGASKGCVWPITAPKLTRQQLWEEKLRISGGGWGVGYLAPPLVH